MILFLYDENLTDKLKKLRAQLCKPLLEIRLTYSIVSNPIWPTLTFDHKIICGPLEQFNPNYHIKPGLIIDNILYTYSLAYLATHSSEFKKSQTSIIQFRDKFLLNKGKVCQD